MIGYQLVAMETVDPIRIQDPTLIFLIFLGLPCTYTQTHTYVQTHTHVCEFDLGV